MQGAGETPLLDAQTELESAFAALHLGEPTAAALHLSAAHQRAPSDAHACGSLGLALVCAGEDEAGLQLLERAHFLEPHDARFLFLYGLALEKRGQITQARLRYEGVLRLAPGLERVRQRLVDLPDPLAQALHRLQNRAAPPGLPAPPPGAALDREDRPSEQAPDPPSEAVPLPSAALPVKAPPAVSLPSPERPAFSPLVSEAPEVDSRPPLWSPPLPGFAALLRNGALLWVQRPLLWVALFGIPNGLCAFLALTDAQARTWNALIWVLCFALGAAPALRQMGAQWTQGRPLSAAELLSPSLAAAAAATLGYAGVALLPAMLAGAAGTNAPLALLLTLLLLCAAPFHALAAPAFAVVTSGGSPMRAAVASLRLAGKRTWLHLGVVLAAGLGLGGLLAVIGWGLAATLKGEGALLARLVEIGGVSAAESLWAALVTVCGHDALAARPREKLG